MNLRKLKNQAGFTLVELIVVIAIMAILAGVAVPVYSGYIEKAEKAGDLQLLGAVNSAFAAAVVENGSTPQMVDAGATIDADKTMGSVSASGIDSAKLNESFNRYFAGNETAVFKSITGLGYDKVNGVFVDLATAKGDVTLSYKGSYVTVPAESIQAVQGSTFGEMGADTLLGQVDYVTNIVGGLLDADNDALWNVVNDDYIDNLVAKLGLSDEYLDELDATGKTNDFLANSLILNVAQNAADIDSDAILKGLSDGTLAGTLYSNVTSMDSATSQAGLAQTALAYGMYASYVYNTTGKTTDISSMTALEEALGDSKFQAYMAEPKAQQDMNAYMEALKVVDSSAQTTEAAISVLENGFDDPELIKLFQSVIGA